MGFFDILLVLGHGVIYTVIVTLVCSMTGLVVGLLLSSLHRLSIKSISFLIDIYTYVFRGVPVLVLLFMVYFGLPGIGLKPPPLLAMALSLGLVTGAYLTEVFRGAFESVEPAEIVAAQAMGMTRIEVLRYIEIPQMLRFSIPGMVNEFTSVLKYSPFAYTVGIPEITKQAMTLTATTLNGIEIYFVVGVLYFVIYRILLAGVHLMQKHYEIPSMKEATV
ncbi:amino acid ABC transporter permease [Polynucleobacter paneuropaeus]|jgi:polar amino acid transport system permease protein|nr:amino acid ABC transporter permease [Polynucleobacter paneuropaeus]MBT8536932.1 amino acid ABC transporter permease [Polynucleobacter paneuropaeus]MBT8543468.1 amino acid ABC transporter permease [Polynucleobacter paneuropaeus]MBT8561896.1 amino acid ABC transporter permease [Polynucleobacter paneuropaeus]MBT8569407.1 amino acid ABC transporter permease [Polynucleobacter paneuropaeus]